MRRKDWRTCNVCGRPLTPGEVCNCCQPVPGMPRDGLRARCPYFAHRSSYKGRSYIVCGGWKTAYADSDARNTHYRRYCCGLYALCTQYQITKGEREACQQTKP